MKKKEKEKEHERQKEIMTEHIQKHSRPNRNLRSDYWLSSGAKQKGKSIAKFFALWQKIKLERGAVECVMQNHLKIMSSRPIFPRPWRRLSSAHWGHHSRRHIFLSQEPISRSEISGPVRMKCNGSREIFVSTAGGISVPKGSTIWHQNGNECIRFHPIFLVPFSFFLVWYRTGSH